MTVLFHPTDDVGNCALCRRRHHPGKGCPRWKKMTDAGRKRWLENHKEGK